MEISSNTSTYTGVENWDSLTPEQKGEEVLKIAIGGDNENPQYSMYDTDGDGKVTTQDALAILESGNTTGTNTTTNDGSTNTTTDNSTTTVTPAVDYSGDFTGVNQGIAGVAGQVGGVQNTADQIVGDVAGVATDVGAVQTAVDNVTGQVTGLGSAIGTPTDGETVLGNQAELEAGQATIKSNMDTGFADSQTDRDAQTNKIMSEIQAKYDLTDSQMQKLSSDILSGQSTLADDLAKMSTSQDTYYGGLAGTQAEMQDSLGNITGNLGDFRTTYDENTTQQNLRQGEFMNQVAGGFDLATQQREAIANQNTMQGSQLQDSLASASAKPFSDVAVKLTNNVPATTETAVSEQNNFLSTLNNIRQATANTQPSNPNYSWMKEISDAFDENGKLIGSEQYDPVKHSHIQLNEGDQILRALTEDGSLVTNYVNAGGMSMNNTSRNLDALMAQFSGDFQGQGLMS